jgi:MFS family permease
VLYAALPFFVYQRTGSTIATAGMIAAELGPSIVVGSLAGVYVDRLDRRRLLVATNVLQAATVAVLLVVARGGPLGVVYAVAAAQSVLASFSQPAESALLPSLVPERDLIPANALNALNNRIARLFGVPVGGLLFGFLGLRPVVLVDAASFLAAALLIAAIAAPRPRAVEDETASELARSAFHSFWAEWIDGLRLMRRDRTIAVIFGVLGLMTFGGTMLDPLTVAWVRDVLDAGPQVYAWVLTIHATSGIVATLLVGRFGHRVSPRTLMAWPGIAAGCVNFVKYNVPSVTLALSLAVVVGITSVMSSVGTETLVMRSVRDEYRGRVFGALGASGALLSLLGGVFAGTLAEVVGIVPMLNVSTALILLAGIVVLRAFPRERAPRPAAVASARRARG